MSFRPHFATVRQHLALPIGLRAGAGVAVFALLTGCSRDGLDSGKEDATARGTATDSATKDTSAAVTLSAAQIRNGQVAWQPVTMGAGTVAVAVPGQLAPNEDRTARLGAPASGRVTTVAVRPGDRVQRNDVLVRLQSREAGAVQSDLAKAQAELSSRRAQAAYANAARGRAERLLALKAIPRQDYERAVADDQLALSAVAQAEAELTRARTTAEQLGATASASGEMTLRAPFDGVVLARNAVPGTVVDVGAPLVVVTDPTTLWLTVNAPEAIGGVFRTRATVRFSVPAYPGETFTARIDGVGAGLDPGTRTLAVRGVVDNRTGRLKAEMLATVMAAGGRPVVAAMVPDDAVQVVKGKTVVFLAKPAPNGGATFTRREVDVGSRTDGRAAIVHGLVAGDVVVIHGAFAVKAELEKGSMPKMEM